MNTDQHPVDRILPKRQMITLGLQHMLVAYIGAIAVPLIVASALKMSPADTTVLISTALVAPGLFPDSRPTYSAFTASPPMPVGKKWLKAMPTIYRSMRSARSRRIFSACSKPRH